MSEFSLRRLKPSSRLRIKMSVPGRYFPCFAGSSSIANEILSIDPVTLRKNDERDPNPKERLVDLETQSLAIRLELACEKDQSIVPIF